MNIAFLQLWVTSSNQSINQSINQSEFSTEVQVIKKTFESAENKEMN